MFIPASGFATFGNPTMLYCNPNACFFEFTVYQNEWLDYYVNNGINVILWNYWGYGKTKGSVNPYKIWRDGVAVVKYY